MRAIVKLVKREGVELNHYLLYHKVGLGSEFIVSVNLVPNAYLNVTGLTVSHGSANGDISPQLGSAVRGMTLIADKQIVSLQHRGSRFIGHQQLHARKSPAFPESIIVDAKGYDSDLGIELYFIVGHWVICRINQQHILHPEPIVTEGETRSEVFFSPLTIVAAGQYQVA